MVVIAPRGAKRSAREELAIKGPGIRLDLDVRRVWRCPSCQRVLKTAGHITSRRCPIDGAFMQLDDSAQRAARRFSFPSISIDEDESPPDQALSTQPANDEDSDRPRKQSRKQKRRRQKPTGSEADTEFDSNSHLDTPVTETVETTATENDAETGTDSGAADDSKPDAEDASRGLADQ